MLAAARGGKAMLNETVFLLVGFQGGHELGVGNGLWTRDASELENARQPNRPLGHS
jgi:hypothetical protein